MVGERDRIIKLKNYIEALGIDINIGKNKARGNKGFFKVNLNKKYRIDIAKNLPETDVLSVLVHELSHYVHYNYDKTLKSLNFIFGDKFNDYEEDLIALTVDIVPKEFAEKLFNNKYNLKKEISVLSVKIKDKYPDLKLNDRNNKIEKFISKQEFKHLLKYDCVKILKGFNQQIYSVETIDNDLKNIEPEIKDYIKLCSLKRKLKRINNKISRLNKYYNNPSELFARSLEMFILNPVQMKEKTPNLYYYYKETIPKIKLLSDILETKLFDEV